MGDINSVRVGISGPTDEVLEEEVDRFNLK